MTDSHGEGRRREAVIAARHREAGWMVWQPPRTKFGSQDIFGVGDLLCFKDGKVIMIQVCDKKSVARHRRIVEAWNDAYDDVLPCYLIVWIGSEAEEGPSRAQGGKKGVNPHQGSPKPSKRVESNARPLPARKEGKA